MMRKSVLAAALACAALSSPVFADAKKEAFCQVNADVIQQLVDFRLDRVGKNKAVKALMESENASLDYYETAVTQWSDWIYGQPRKDAKTFSSEAFYEACLKQ